MKINCNIDKPSVINYILKCFKCCFDFKSRACRKEFWSFALFDLCVTIWFAIIITIVVNILDSCKVPPDNIVVMTINILKIPLIIPVLAVTVRRLHDLNKSGLYVILPCLCVMLEILKIFPKGVFKEYYWYLVAFNLTVYIFYVLFFFMKNGNSGTNKYGTDPMENKTNNQDAIESIK